MKYGSCPVERARSEERKAAEEGLRWDICVDVLDRVTCESCEDA